MIFSDSPSQKALERMMTQIKGFPPRGSGVMVLRRFEYTAEMCDCRLCLYYNRKKKCTVSQCPCIEERIIAGAADRSEVMAEIMKNIHNAAFHRRLNQFINESEELHMNFRNEKHRLAFVEAIHKLDKKNFALMSAIYLLTAEHKLWMQMKERTMATIRELGFCHLNSREDFIAIRRFFDHETFDDKFLTEELMLTEIMLPSLEAAELKEIRMRITEDYDVRRAAMFLKLLRNSYSSSGKSFASQPFDIRKLFGVIQELEDRMANVVIENQDFETLIRHYDRPDAFFYADPPYFSTEDMYEVGFGWDDHVRLRETLGRIKGKFLLSYNDCPEIRELYDGFSLFDFSRTHSVAQRYEAGKEFKELLIANYDYYERENAKPKQLTLFDIYGDENYDYEKILKESIISCKIR